MWCKNCNIEVIGDKCPVCDAPTEENIPNEIFWCSACAVPVITPLTAKSICCPLCSKEMCRLAADIRPVFPEERLLLAALFDKSTNEFMDCSVWATGSRYYIDGKAITVSPKTFVEADINSIVSKISGVAVDYARFDDDVFKFIFTNRYRLAALKDETDSFVKSTAKNFPFERVVISFSGGKDSTVVADIVVRALNNASLVHIFGNTTLEFPSTLAYAARYRANHPLAVFQNAVNDEQNFFTVCEDIGPPARMMRWCCSMFKTGPISRVINNLYRDQKILTFYGIRKSESVTRSKYNRVEGEAESIKIRQQTVASPIFFGRTQMYGFIFFPKGLISIRRIG